jgi:cytoskeletal protein CcmA (bactofilin family)
MRLNSALALSILFALSAYIGTARAAGFDGVYVGKSKMATQSYSQAGSAVSCKREYDIKLTVAGNSVTGENLSIGGKASGTVQSDGSFTAQGGLAVQTQARIQGKIQGNTIRATYTQMTRNATCTGTLQAVRQ